MSLPAPPRDIQAFTGGQLLIVMAAIRSLIETHPDSAKFQRSFNARVAGINHELVREGITEPDFLRGRDEAIDDFLRP